MMKNLPFALSHIMHLCVKEWRALAHDTFLVFFIIFAFSCMVYAQAESITVELHRSSVGVVDEDHSMLSHRFIDALLPPYFGKIESLQHKAVDPAMESAKDTFVLQMPMHMESDLRAGKKVTIQLLIDASAIGQAMVGTGYIENIIKYEALRYFNRQALAPMPVDLIAHYDFNQGQQYEWFEAVAALIQNITMLSVLLTGAALLRERESGTIEHLLVMPITPIQIVLSKVIANGTVILVLAYLSIEIMLRAIIGVHINGSLFLFMLVSALYLFFTAGLGIFLGTIARSMPQMGLLFIITILPMVLLSGSFTPLESMPLILQHIMAFVPSTPYVSMAQAILFRGAGIGIIWTDMILVTGVGLMLFAFSTIRFRGFLERQG